MATSAETKETKRLLRELRAQRTSESQILAKQQGHEELDAEIEDVTEACEHCYQTMREHSEMALIRVRARIETLKAFLATREHVPNKAERRQARQDAAKNRTRSR